jgi:Mrp family chromosome partitioning ATPase
LFDRRRISTGQFTLDARQTNHRKQKSLPADRQSCFTASMIISLVNSKGGVGKSTLAGNLAGWLASHGRSVILADCDTQQSSSEWIAEALPEIQVVCLVSHSERASVAANLKP